RAAGPVRRLAVLLDLAWHRRVLPYLACPAVPAGGRPRIAQAPRDSMAGVTDDELYRQYETVNLYRRGPGAKVELNRPERMNAWNRQFSADLLDVITEVTENPEVRAVLVTGAGRAFSSGADLKEATEDAGAGTVDVYKIRTGR